MEFLIFLGLIAFLAVVIIPAAVKIVQQYEAGVVFRLGRLVGVKSPGLRIIIPFIDQMRKVDTRVVTMDVPAQEVITRDNVTVKVNAVVYFRVIHPENAIIQVSDYKYATFQVAQTTLRSVLGKSELDDLLAHREKINESLKDIIDEATEPWGIKVSMVEVKDVELPASMQRAMAVQAEAERERRGKIVHAEGEFEASQKLAEAARILTSQPAALQLRYLQVLSEIATEKTNTLIFPVPIDLINTFLNQRQPRGQT